MRVFPPNKVADLDRKNAGNFMELLRTIKTSPITLILGAGVSTSAGLPSWNTLLNKICASFFYHWEYLVKLEKESINTPPKEISIAFYSDESWSKESFDISNMFTEQDALLAAQQIKNCIRDSDWRYLLRKNLYNYDLCGEYHISESDLICSLAKLCVGLNHLQSIISYNWDNLVELELKSEKINVSAIWESGQKWHQKSLPIYYPHGYLPLDGDPKSKIVLAESDYHQEATEFYSWANIIQTQAFSNSVCIFIGCSMIDPNIRRLLEISTKIASVSNYAFLPSLTKKEKFEKMFEVLFDYDLYRLGVKVIRFPIDKKSDNPYSRLPELIEIMKNYLADEETIWI